MLDNLKPKLVPYLNLNMEDKNLACVPLKFNSEANNGVYSNA